MNYNPIDYDRWKTSPDLHTTCECGEELRSLDQKETGFCLECIEKLEFQESCYEF